MKAAPLTYDRADENDEPEADEIQGQGVAGRIQGVRLKPVATSGIEHHSTDFIPDAERHGRLSQQGIFWFLGNTQSLTVLVGFTGPTVGLSVAWSLLALALGTLLGTLFMALHASQGPHIGKPQMIQSRAQFGYRGVVIPLVLNVFACLVFTVADSVILGPGLKGLFGWDPHFTGIAIGIIAVILAGFGYDYLHRSFALLFWVSLPLWLLLTGAILTGHAGAGAHPLVQDPRIHVSFAVAFLLQFATAASINISYAPVVSDYTRYLPRSTSFVRIILWVFGGAAASEIWLGGIGVWLATWVNNSDALVAVNTAANRIIPGIPLGPVITIVSALALVVTMGLCAYSGALTILTAATSLNLLKRPTTALRLAATVAQAVLWVYVGVFRLTRWNTFLDDALPLVLYLFIPWSSINLVDYFFIRRGEYAITEFDRPDGLYAGWAWRGAVTYLVGLAAMVPFVKLSFFKGGVAQALHGVDLAFLPGILVSAILYYALTRSQDPAADAAAAAVSHAQLVSAGLIDEELVGHSAAS